MHCSSQHLQQKKSKQDSRLTTAYFSPNYKYFDQLLQTVKNETTVLNLVLKGFLQTSILPLIYIFYEKKKRGYHDFPLKIFCLTVPKNFVGELFCVSENFCYRKFSCIGGGEVSRFSVVLVKLKNVGEGWDSNPYLALQNPDVLPTVLWEQLEFLTNVSEIIKIYDPTEIRTGPTAWEMVVLTPLLKFIFE